MGAIFRYELKKIVSRKAVWLILSFSAAFMLYANLNPIKEALGGYLRGMLDIYGRYEGRVITRAFQQEAHADFVDYALSHADYYNTGYDEGQGTVFYSAKNYNDYYAGVERAFENLTVGESVESLQRSVNDARDTLQLGKKANGSPLTQQEKRALEAKVKAGFDTPVVQYLEGWNYLGRMMGDGLFVLFLLLLGLLPLFTQESSARMEGVLLGSAKRGRAAMAKMLAAAAFTLATALLIYGFETLLMALIYGLGGASQPISALYRWSFHSNQTIAGFYLQALLTAVLMALANAALIALASSLFRQPLPALLLAAALIAGQFLLGSILPGIVSGGSPEGSGDLQRLMNLLPAPALVSPWQWLDSLRDAKFAAFALALPVSLAAFVFAFSPRHFLRQRKV